MPICGRIRHFERLVDYDDSFKFIVHERSRSIPFLSYFQRAFPLGFVQNLDPARGAFIVSAGAQESVSEIEGFLDLLRRSVTILGTADESHALEMRWYRDLDQPSTIGSLVRAAKPYGRESGDRAKAAELTRLAVEWVRSHPAYRGATTVAAIPPSNRQKAYDLPFLIAKEIAGALGVEHTAIQSSNRIERKRTGFGGQEKGEHSIAGAFRTNRNLAGHRVLLIDDLYGTGQTMSEGVRALRAAGAKAVFCLAMTKNASHTDGLEPLSSNWGVAPNAALPELDTLHLPFE